MPGRTLVSPPASAPRRRRRSGYIRLIAASPRPAARLSPANGARAPRRHSSRVGKFGCRAAGARLGGGYVGPVVDDSQDPGEDNDDYMGTWFEPAHAKGDSSKTVPNAK